VTSTSLPLPASERMQRALLAQLSIVTGAAWALALYAGMQAPWVNDIMAFIAPESARAMSTGAYLFSVPLILLLALAVTYFGRESVFRAPFTRNPRLAGALAGGLFSLLFVISLIRTAQTLRLGGV